MLRDLTKPPARPNIVKDLARVNLSLLNTTSHYSVLNNQSSDSINTINSNVIDTTGGDSRPDTELVSFDLQEEEEETGGLTKSDSAFTWQSKKHYFSQSGPLDVEIISKELLRQLSYAIKNQIKAPKAPLLAFRWFFIA